MLLFLDTEYTGLGQPRPKLISLALVAEDGSREFYAELADTWTPDDCTPFVQREVLPLLAGPRLSRVEACAALREWFGDAPRTTGAGKSWLACALAQYACRRGHSALYLRVPRLGEELRVLHGNGGFTKWLLQVARVDVLLLDDWGMPPPRCVGSKRSARDDR